MKTGLKTSTHTEVVEDNGGELAECFVTRCEQLDSLLRERGEGVCPLEADRDQADPVVPSGVEGTSEANGCTRSLGGMEAPEPIVVARIPSVVTSVVPVCVVSKCVYTSVLKCVLRRTHSGSARACVRATPCVNETPGMSKTPCVEATPCVSGVVASVPECMLPSTPCVKGAPRVKEAACAPETARVCEARGVSGAACVQGTARVCEQPCGSEAGV